ncbi:SRPBCC domain-containing protein [Streptomyces sp. NPDC051445]|uniref:SRPBCC domain-containing protein n=1 Tax=unclassified Streptomyces TaxID=2593676 RepID=UPI0037B738BC
MSKEFEIAREFEVDATPQQVWDAFTAGTGGWLWPMEEPEPHAGGKGPFGSTVTVWDPPHRYTNRVENVDGISEQTLNQLDYTVEPRDDGRRAWVRYVHSGIFVDDWDNQYDAAGRHTDFYLHTLREYLTHFDGRPVAFVTFDGPDASKASGALTAVARALGLADDASEGTSVRGAGPEGRSLDAVVDFRNPYFVGLRTDNALVRFFGRNHWGYPVGVSVHDFARDADAEANETAWRGWLDAVFSRPL